MDILSHHRLRKWTKTTQADPCSIRRFEYTYARRDLPGTNYIMTTVDLPKWMYITIETKGDTMSLFVHSRIHGNKRVKVGPDYKTPDFTPTQMLKELSYDVWNRFIRN